MFDELQNELLSLKRAMRSKEEDASKKVTATLQSNQHWPLPDLLDPLGCGFRALPRTDIRKLVLLQKAIYHYGGFILVKYL